MINIPHDVSWAMAIRISRAAVGRETYERLERIIKEYPEYFPWDTKYGSIPQEVHKAYRDEKYPPWDGVIKKGKGKGIWEQMQEKPKRRRKSKCIDLRQVFKEMLEHQEKMRKKKERQEKKNKKLWDKHYKKYNLEYRG